MRKTWQKFSKNDIIYDFVNGRMIKVVESHNEGKRYLCNVYEYDYEGDEGLKFVDYQMFNFQELVNMEVIK